MEQASQAFPGTSFQIRTRPTEQTSSMQSSSSEDQSGLRALPQRKSPPKSKNIKTPAKINTSQTSMRNGKPMSAGPRSGNNHSAIAAMSGTISPAHEITYTPTTHRISKAKKGKKVHACEYPGCTKIFTRAEHRKRHEANHNAVPAFQCDIEGCRKPFQRADLLTRHMERQHNMPVGSPSIPNPQARRSTSETSTALSNPATPSIVRPSIPHQQPLGLSPMPQPTRAMSIGSLVDHASFPSSTFTHSTHLPIPAPAHTFSTTDFDPYTSSDSSCYSPSNVSDLIQPQPYLPPDDLPRPQTAGLECGFPQTAVWTSGYGWEGQAPMTAPLQGLGVGATRHFTYPSPTFMGVEGIGAYDLGGAMPFEWGQGAQWARKMTF